VSMVDTNCNPDDIDYPVPSNDDAMRTIKLVCNKIAESVIEARGIEEEAALAEVEVTLDDVEADVKEKAEEKKTPEEELAEAIDKIEAKHEQKAEQTRCYGLSQRPFGI